MKRLWGKPIPSSEITPEHVYLNRRQFMKAAGLGSAGALLAACGPSGGEVPETGSNSGEAPAENAPDTAEGALSTSAQTDEMGDPLNTYDEITNYNNFYEFTQDKADVAPMSQDFNPSPWEVQVDGLVNNPKTFSMEEILQKYPSEERIYRLRCVEGWSMVIPWMGFPLSALLKEVEPTGDAKYVAFTTLQDPERFPGQKFPFFPWPYTEGLRMDEAMHDLTLMVTGLYGKPVPAQNGAPLRLAVPWKYGFKSIKSIVRISLVEEEPPTLWSTVAPDEYGFYANVNPEVSHPRWSQASERRIGETGRRETLMFNGYQEEVASLYAGMDLKANY